MATSPEDEAFRQDFEAGRIAPADFNHAAHVRLAYVYLCSADVDSAAQQMRASLLRFLEQNAIPASKFHETITRAWVLAVRHFMDREAGSSHADFIARHPVLLDSRIMLSHYSVEVLFSADARAGFIAPDIEPIP